MAINKAVVGLACLLLISACSPVQIDSVNPPKTYFLGLYVDYIISMDNGSFYSNLDNHYSSKTIEKLKSELGGNIDRESLGWLIYATHISLGSIKQYYLKFDSDKSACFTVVGLSREKTPKHVNLRFIEEDTRNWKITKFNSEIFDESVKPEHPGTAICPATD